MENFFNKVDKSNTDASYHNPYKFLTPEEGAARSTKRMGDVVTTLWVETAGLTVFMSLIVLTPSLFKLFA